MAAAGIFHARGLENVLLKELLKRRSGDLLDNLRQKIVAGVGILERLARRAVGLRLRFEKEARYLRARRHAVLLLPEIDEPIHIVEVIGDAARVAQELAHRHALVLFKLREELYYLVVKAELPLAHSQHYRRGRELLGHGRQLEYRVLFDRERAFGIAEAHNTL